ncbi:proline--tRNA ligase [candidate division NPL-UPA2 bacterium]|nr:proline--tRNA ligase [candidate division NPL-UPA2 bacterium]
MKWSQSLIRTLREAPREAEAVSHKLMLRAGLARKLAAGLYTYLPLGLRAIRKVEDIVRQEMNKKGAQELLMPTLQPKELWEQSGRWDDKELGMLKLKNREEREFVLGPTHEEIITDLVSKEVRSYKELPLNLYQIQTKFRDEMRPRFGMIRAREFIMKDAYSFHVDEGSARKGYQDMYEAYSNIFRRCGLKTQVVEADPGAMGGSKSEEFIALADSGEDIIVSCPQCNYAANLESAQQGDEQLRKSREKMKLLEEIETPGIKTIKELEDFLGEKPEKMIKTLIYSADGKTVAALIAGHRELSEVKLRKNLKCENLEMADERLIEEVTGGPLGFSGPVGLKKVKIIADVGVTKIVNGITGANKQDKHIRNVNMGRDYNPDEVADISYVREGDRCPKCSHELAMRRGIEVGHIFNLGRRYSQSLGAKFLNEKGEETLAIMGCYGIGITRTVAAIIEQNHDENGIVWPMSVSPYQVHIILLNVNSRETVKVADNLYNQLTGEGVETLLDDRDERAGVKFKDADLIGVPLRLIVSPRRVAEKKAEIKHHRDGRELLIAIGQVREKVKELIQENLSSYGQA